VWSAPSRIGGSTGNHAPRAALMAWAGAAALEWMAALAHENLGTQSLPSNT